jgi:hypothetical protein
MRDSAPKYNFGESATPKPPALGTIRRSEARPLRRLRGSISKLDGRKSKPEGNPSQSEGNPNPAEGNPSLVSFTNPGLSMGYRRIRLAAWEMRRNRNLSLRPVKTRSIWPGGALKKETTAWPPWQEFVGFSESRWRVTPSWRCTRRREAAKTVGERAMARPLSPAICPCPPT